MVGLRKLRALCLSVSAIDVEVKEITFFSSRLDEGFQGHPFQNIFRSLLRGFGNSQSREANFAHVGKGFKSIVNLHEKIH